MSGQCREKLPGGKYRTDHVWASGWEERIAANRYDPCQCGAYVRRLQYVDTRAPSEPTEKEED